MLPLLAFTIAENRIIISITCNKIPIFRTNHDYHRIFPPVRKTSPKQFVILKAGGYFHLGNIQIGLYQNRGLQLI